MRTHYCGQVNESLVGQQVAVAGWVHRRRDHGGVIFVDLQTFEVDFDTTARLRALIPPEIAVVGESGLKTAEDMSAMRTAGVDAVLVGEALARSKDVVFTARAFVAAGRE